MTSVFDPQTFIKSEFTGANETQLIPVPKGQRPGQIIQLAGRQFNDKNGESRTVMDVTWHILDDESAAVTGLPKPTVRMSVFLEFNERGALEMGKGKNVALGRLREAVGQNDPKKPWKPEMLLNARATCEIDHRTGEDGNDYALVKRVTAA